MDCTLPGSSVYGISQARKLEWVAISFSGGSSPPRDQTWVSCIGTWILYCWVARKAHRSPLTITNQWIIYKFEYEKCYHMLPCEDMSPVWVTVEDLKNYFKTVFLCLSSHWKNSENYSPKERRRLSFRKYCLLLYVFSFRLHSVYLYFSLCLAGPAKQAFCQYCHLKMHSYLPGFLGCSHLCAHSSQWQSPPWLPCVHSLEDNRLTWARPLTAPFPHSVTLFHTHACSRESLLLQNVCAMFLCLLESILKGSCLRVCLLTKGPELITVSWLLVLFSFSSFSLCCDLNGRYGSLQIWPNNYLIIGLLQWLSGKETTCNAGDTGDSGSIPGSGRSPGGGYGHPLQHSCLKNSTDRVAWQNTVYEVTKSWTQLSNRAYII